MNPKDLIAAIMSDPLPFNPGDKVEYIGKEKNSKVSKSGEIFTCGTESALVWFKDKKGDRHLGSIAIKDLKRI